MGVLPNHVHVHSQSGFIPRSGGPTLATTSFWRTLQGPHHFFSGTMNAVPPQFPVSVAGDPNEVATALDVASAFWEKGDNSEAIRWLNRAVVAANQGGDSERAARLAQAAGELQAAIEGRTPEAAPSAPPPAESTPPSMQPASVPPAQEAWPDSSKRVQLAPPVAPSAATAPSLRLDGWMRVSVKTSVRDPKLLVLRTLTEGEPAPAGTREGFLAFANSAPSAPKKSNGGGAA